MHHMYGNWGWSSPWDWLAMTLMILLWVAVIGAVIYAAVRLGVRHEHESGHTTPPTN